VKVTHYGVGHWDFVIRHFPSTSRQRALLTGDGVAVAVFQVLENPENDGGQSGAGRGRQNADMLATDPSKNCETQPRFCASPLKTAKEPPFLKTALVAR